jgi:hypothetical protein
VTPLAFVNGPIFVEGGRRTGLAVGARGGRIVTIGPPADVLADVGAGADIVDLEGRMLLPGFQDAHVHPGSSGLDSMRCSLDECESAEEVAAAIAGYAATRPPGDWIRGAGWTYTHYRRGCPSAQELDSIVGDRPAFLEVRDGHSAWASSEALRLAGIGVNTPDPRGGRIERLADGRPQGTLHEAAMHLVRAVIPEDTPDEREAGILEGQRYLLSLGVTAWQDASVEPGFHDAYLALAGRGELHAQVRGALRWDPDGGVEQTEGLAERRSQGLGNYHPEAVKLMLDGVIENYTASMLEPYIDESGRRTAAAGLDFIDPAALADHVRSLDALGFQCHFHAIGDGAVRSALDATAAARLANGDRDLRHTAAHIQVVDPSDIPRFAAVGLIPNAQPLWACMEEAMTVLTIPHIGEGRGRHQYPFGSLHRSGARLAMGSDWGVTTANVMKQVHVAVHRSLPGGDPLLTEESIDLSTAMTAFTAGSAYVNHLDADRGTLAVGKVADLVVLDHDPFEQPGTWDVAVDLTLVGGVVRYERGR